MIPGQSRAGKPPGTFDVHRASCGSVPILLRVLVVLLTAQVALDAVGLALHWAHATGAARLTELGALAIDVAMLVALASGREWVRRLLRVGAAIGVTIDVILVTLLVGYGADAMSLATGVVLLAGSAFTWWALGHASVERWVFARWMDRRGV